ncbi:MAG: ATP-binding protein [Candidatus Hodarchaeales archaeon]|jgi:ferredoxin
MQKAHEIKLDPFEKLAKTLNKIPNGFTNTKDDIHLKVLKWIFTEDEADLASKMKLMGETLEELSSRLDIAIEGGLGDKLEKMVKKGQILGINTSTGRRYALMPYIVGIYEEQLDRMDQEFAQIHEDYMEKHEENGLFDTEPPIFKVIPIKRVIKTELTIYPYEIAEVLIKRSKSWGVRECVCKKQQNLLGKPCSYPTTVCLVFSRRENTFDEDELSQSITKQEALKHLKDAEKAGLIHCSMNVQTGQNYICNCCTCCCAILRNLTEWGRHFGFVKSNFQIQVDDELCEGCETCVDRCPFGALEVIDALCEVDLTKCVGCGVCAVECPEEALSLVARHPEETSQPPETVKDWMTQKAMSRKVDPSDLL